MEWLWPVPPDQYSIYLLGSSDSGFWSDFWAAAFGALVGAGAAFGLEIWRRSAQERNNRVAAGNLALLTMFQMWFEIYNYEKNIIRQAAKRPDDIPLWLRVSLLARTPADLEFNAADLIFLLRTKSPATLATTILQQTRYHELFNAVIVRNTALSRAREKMARQHIGIAVQPTDGELVDAIGIPDIAQLRTLTLGIIEQVYKNLSDMSTAYYGLRSALVAEFGGKDVVAFDLERKFPAELEMPLENWLIFLTFENNDRPRGPPFNAP